MTELKSTDTGELGLNENCPEVAIKKLNHHPLLNNFQSTPGNITKHYEILLDQTPNPDQRHFSERKNLAWWDDLQG